MQMVATEFRGLFLQVFVVVTLYGSVCSFVFVVAVRRYYIEVIIAREPERGGHHIAHYIAVIVFTCPDVAAF